MNAGEVITSQHLEAMLETQGLGKRGIHPGDVVYVYTGRTSIYLKNIKLDELARERVLRSCTIVLPLREKGASGSPIRPVAIGAPRE
jgi:hypothetical protein